MRVMRKNREVRASISTDSVKSTYNHLRHRLMRPAGEGGRELPEAEADAIARKHVCETFFEGGAWRIQPLDCVALGRVITSGDRALSVEDALEFQTYQAARAERAGPAMFVTRDTDFPEGVHPTHVARECGWI
jgi:hypothetical protein